MGIFGAEAAEETLHLGQASERAGCWPSWRCSACPWPGFLLTGLLGRRLGQRPWIIAVAAILVGDGHRQRPGASGALLGAEPVRLGFTLYTWIPAGDLQVEFGFLFDNLTAVMLIVVTWIGSLVHVYSIGYMAHDPGKWRFFAYLNLFMFSMLLLVLADSYLVIFAAWELVGLSSYLLIGFWYQRRAPALASKKAFLVNRVADQGFVVGIMGVFLLTGTMNILDSFAPFEAADAHRAQRSWPCCSSWAPPASRPSSPSTSGCPTPWRAPRRSPPSSTPRPWSTPASTSSPARRRSSPPRRRPSSSWPPSASSRPSSRPPSP